jgi:DNA mismatch repair protein MSH6
VVDHLIASPEIVSHIAQHLRKLPDLELLLGRTKSSLKVSSPILLPLLVKKILKQRVGSIAVKEIHMAIYINTEIFTG